MLERIDTPATVLAFRAVGTIEKSDYETVLRPAVEAMIAEHGEVRFVYVLGDEFGRYGASAAWEDAKLGLGNLTKWKRVALVTNHDWLRNSMRMFGWMLPGEFRTFGVSEQADAIAWAAG